MTGEILHDYLDCEFRIKQYGGDFSVETNIKFTYEHIVDDNGDGATVLDCWLELTPKMLGAIADSLDDEDAQYFVHLNPNAPRHNNQISIDFDSLRIGEKLIEITIPQRSHLDAEIQAALLDKTPEAA